jgi:tumor protein p53-inducible protein 3
LRAILVREPGGPEQLELGEHPQPQPGDDEMLVKVRAAALNRADILQRQGKYPPPSGASPLLGLDIAGVVERAGPRCADWKPGERVFGLLSGGGYAEYAVLPCAMAMRVPDALSFEEAAAIPEAFLTAYQCLFWLARFERGERVLIHAGASGVGTAAIQLAREAGAYVLATAGEKEKLDACRRLGAEVAIDYRAEDFAEVVLQGTAGRGADVILDFVGASFWEQNWRTVAVDGRWILIGTLGGSRVERLDLGALMRKCLQLTGTTLRGRSLEYKSALTRDFASSALPALAQGRLRPVVDRVFPWQQVADAHRYMEENRNIGKIVLNGM